MYWTTTTETLLILHELAHMNSRARARHRVAAATHPGALRKAHEQAADRHAAFAKQLSDRLVEMGAHFAAKASLSAPSDAQNGPDAQSLLQSGRARLLARYAEAIAEPLDVHTRLMLATQLEALRAESQPFRARTAAVA